MLQVNKGNTTVIGSFECVFAELTVLIFSVEELIAEKLGQEEARKWIDDAVRISRKEI